MFECHLQNRQKEKIFFIIPSQSLWFCKGQISTVQCFHFSSAAWCSSFKSRPAMNWSEFNCVELYFLICLWALFPLLLEKLIHPSCIITVCTLSCKAERKWKMTLCTGAESSRQESNKQKIMYIYAQLIRSITIFPLFLLRTFEGGHPYRVRLLIPGWHRPAEMRGFRWPNAGHPLAEEPRGPAHDLWSWVSFSGVAVRLIAGQSGPAARLCHIQMFGWQPWQHQDGDGRRTPSSTR